MSGNLRGVDSHRKEAPIRRGENIQRGPSSGKGLEEDYVDTDRGYDGEVPGPVDVSVGAVDVVMFDPLDVRLEIAKNTTAKLDGLADVRRLIAGSLRDDRRVWKNR